jgi:hypothetical protein
MQCPFQLAQLAELKLVSVIGLTVIHFDLASQRLRHRWISR